MTAPPGFATVTPYIFVDEADALVAFLIRALGGEEVGVHYRPDGAIANAQVRIGNATIMVSEASGAYPAMPASYYLYVDDADAAMARAIEGGATEIMPVDDMPYGDRQGGVRDPHGNIWWISQRLSDAAYY
ncbi:glyoxalase [Sphingomonas sp. Root710]|uniref:VOC family protein n=1 Tax=Sphingomonas sp. Root710 TaxID=1736594 RepID=UPI0006FF3228|nr:VOC family protein [Sphingomonas sp. Root710]KRB83089.1 glyoxalase [Sphingomonas sp. Root710]